MVMCCVMTSIDLLEGELYPGGCVSLEMAQVLVLYLDGLGHYLNKKASEDCSKNFPCPACCGYRVFT